MSVLLSIFPSANRGDSIAYWSAVQAVLHGSNPYDPFTLLPIQQQVFPSFDEAQYFLNPPWAIPLLIPIFAGSFGLSSWILTIVNVLGFVFALDWCRRRWGPLSTSFSTVIGLYVPFSACQYNGQLSILLLVGLVLVLDELGSKQPSVTKTALGLFLCSLKPQTLYLLLFLIPFQILRRSGWGRLLRIAAWSIPACALMMCRSDWVLAWLRTFEYAQQWRTSTTTTYARDVLFTYLPDHFHLFWLYQLFWIGVVSAMRTYRLLEGDRVLLLILLSALTAPYAWIYDFCVLLPVYYLCLRQIWHWCKHQPTKGKWCFYLSLVALAHVMIPFYTFAGESFEVHILYSVGMALLYCLLLALERLNQQPLR